MKDKQIKEFYEFASFRLDVKKRRLMRGDEIVSLTPKEFEVLSLLIENAGRVVEKDKLLDSVWADTFVEEATMTRNISWLRKKLSDNDESDTKFIETVPKRGYRFLPEVTKIVKDFPAVVENGGEEFVYQEQIIQEIQIDENIEIIQSEEENETAFVGGKFHESPEPKALSAAPVKGRISPLWIIPALLLTSLIGLFLYRADVYSNQPKVIFASKIAPFSGLPGREISPAFSPDGKQIVYAWDGGIESKNLDIYVKIVGAGDPVRLTETAEDELYPVYSPDGKSIAFVRNFPTHNEIILIPALGGAERKIYAQAGYASISFSPDGKFLAAANLDLSNDKAGIFLINPANGEKTPITKPENPAIDLSPRFSSDGKSLAFIRYFSSFRREIFVIPAGGGEARQITFDDARIYGLDWSKDNQKLYFTSFRQTGQLGLWQVPISEKSEPTLIPTGSKNLESLTVSPDGRTIAYVEETADENIWELAGQTKRPLIRSIRADHSQQFSPDGSQIVFASDRTGNYEIWLADADGRNQRQLTDSKESAGSPRFSPNGNFIAYDAQSSGSSDIYIVAVNGGLPRRLTDNAENNSLPAWSADGTSIFFISNRSGDEQIWKMPASGGDDPVQITKQGAFEMFAAADGETIIYSKGGNKTGLWLVKTGGGGEEPIPELGEVGGWRSWTVAPDGVYYTSFAVQPPFYIKFFDFATQQTKTITTIEKSPLLYYSNLSVSPDGKKILYARQDQSASSIMLAVLDK